MRECSLHLCIHFPKNMLKLNTIHYSQFSCKKLDTREWQNVSKYSLRLHKHVFRVSVVYTNCIGKIRPIEVVTLYEMVNAFANCETVQQLFMRIGHTVYVNLTQRILSFNFSFFCFRIFDSFQTFIKF